MPAQPVRRIRWILITIVLAASVIAFKVTQTVGHALDGVRSSRAHGDVGQLSGLIRRLRADTGSTAAVCLTNLANLTAVSLPDVCRGNFTPQDGGADTSENWRGPYLPIITNDPWGNPYTAVMDPATDEVAVHCNGPDGEPATADDITR